ncbi:hypothetical protein DPEC_G00311840 [Dallia pectoralis]|uniref:Uncharacterized protein n=1 Tax=Dallia pectoralis TaxID=75939 RepID=A0ACC2FBF5_DALPE|nr:hypothetical protein DPEC_G00311840 [Dallia pectoralis]
MNRSRLGFFNRHAPSDHSSYHCYFHTKMCTVMRVVVVLFLLSVWAGAGMGMTGDQLFNVVKYMRDGRGNVQYAMATGLPKTTCQDGTMTFARPAVLDKQVDTFTSPELIAAYPSRSKPRKHSEYRLLVGKQNGMMKNLVHTV